MLPGVSECVPLLRVNESEIRRVAGTEWMSFGIRKLRLVRLRGQFMDDRSNDCLKSQCGLDKKAFVGTRKVVVCRQLEMVISIIKITWGLINFVV